jgi:CheY-like chemotaxis protein
VGASAIDARDAALHSASFSLHAAADAVPKILVADDNPLSLRFFEAALTELGWTVTLAADGIEAVAAATTERFDALLLDARMPRLDGRGALAHLRSERGPSRDAVAIATTAEAGERVRTALIAEGFADVVTKPVTLATLRETIARNAGSFQSIRAQPEASGSARTLDDAQAFAAAGGDATIVAALRGLLVAELDALPGEAAAMAARNDVEALRDRLHRLDASAGFCGAPALVSAGAALRAAIEDGAWPSDAVARFLAACADVRAALVSVAAAK